MTEPPSRADEAARYILGELSPVEQRAFEAELARSVELRALVQELEEGVEALARSVPQSPPPPQIWTPIEQAVARIEREKIVPAFWTTWWRSGWAAAAACLLGWLGYAFWAQHRSEKLAGEHPALPPEPTQIATAAAEPSSAGQNQIATMPDPLGAALAGATAAQASRELSGLRWQISALQTQVQQLTQALSEQQAALLEPGRFKFFPSSGNGSDTTAKPLSPSVQRALFYAMAQELGWLPNVAPDEFANHPSAVYTTNLYGVDFVYLPIPANLKSAGAAVIAGQAGAASSGESSAGPAMVQASGELPGLLARNNRLWLALDPATVPSGSPVTFRFTGSGQEPFWLGDTITTGNPMVFSLPTEELTSGELTISANTGMGGSNTLGQFFWQTPSLLRTPVTPASP